MILRDVPTPARALAVVGLLPILVPAALVWTLPPFERLIAFDVLVHYAAIMLAFLGAVHWGVAMGAPGRPAAVGREAWWRFGWSVVPAIIAWLATQMVLQVALLVLTIGFPAAYLYDARAARRQWVPDWCRRLRRPLTLVMLVALGAGLARQWF